MNSETSDNQPIAFVETPQPIAELMLSLADLKGKEKTNISVLDAGCGRGVFLRVLSNSGYENVTGVEYNQSLAIECQKEFSYYKIIHKNFLNWDPETSYDLIIGNPPYSHYNSLPSEIQKEVREIVESKESDIYYAFIIKAIDFLNEDGELIFIVPYGFFYNTYAKSVREKIISHGIIDIIIDLDEVRLFDGENPETVIIKFTKKINVENKTMSVLRIISKDLSPFQIQQSAQDSLLKKKTNDDFVNFMKPMFENSEDIWTSYPEIILEKFVILKDIAWVGVGPVSGYDEAFRLMTNEEERFSDTENKLVIGTIKAINCVGYWTEGCTNYVLLDRTIRTEKELVESFPNISEKMMKFEEKMKSRYLPGKTAWFQWQALRNMQEYKKFAGKHKIFVPTLDRSKTNRFSMSDGFFYASGDVLAIVPLEVDPYFLLGYLNSNFFRNYYFSAGARRGHRTAYTQRIMSNIRIPLFPERAINEISQLVKELIRTRNLKLRAKIDEIILKNIH
ncbi:MAG: Eco57I restriction-modification methylase domain-containing protein [Candidatus Heimdallarchaeaceae archaeon]